ncbi:Cathepsin_B [Hexamita inflata]|uniref:Cathepsin B n=1 Tax=Hexamita inflata TaxID=28002 RepID=A0AA86R4U6_9EUKA|nr:Cathepsin B [Hexamita inflata]
MITLVITLSRVHNKSFLEMLKNIPDLTWTPGISQYFLDESIQLSKSQRVNQFSQKTRYVGAPPSSFSWLLEMPECMGVGDTAGCIADWAFSAVGSFSDNRCITGKDSSRVAYSEQYMLSCDSQSNGCDGTSSMQNPQNFLKTMGVPTNQCVFYNYKQQFKCPNTCYDGSKLDLFKSLSFQDVCSGEESIMNAIQQGTIQTQFNVYTDFMYYMGGIYKHVSGVFENTHIVTLIGFGELNGIKFWVVRNSWGTEWGEKGYFRIVRGTNECQIEQQCFFTVV